MAEHVAKEKFTVYVRKNVVRILASRWWPEAVGGILLGLVNILYAVFGKKPFTAFAGFLNWGQHIYNVFNLGWLSGIPKENPFVEKTSVGILGALLGALIASIIANEFRIRRSEIGAYIEAALAGIIMALGVTLAFGCNFGAFFSAVSSLSLHGYAMMVGLIIGGYLGLRYVEWTSTRVLEKMFEKELAPSMPETLAATRQERSTTSKSMYIISILLILLAAIATMYYGGLVPLILLFLGAAIGAILQRARFCFATAFRELLGGVEQARAVRLQAGIALGIIVGATGIALLKYARVVDPRTLVMPIGPLNILGGILFGFGMSIAGACSTGALWRTAEGHTRLWVTMIASILSYPIMVRYLAPMLKSYYTTGIFLPDVLGWAGALAFVYITMLAWILFVLYIAYRRGLNPWE